MLTESVFIKTLPINGIVSSAIVQTQVKQDYMEFGSQVRNPSVNINTWRWMLSFDIDCQKLQEFRIMNWHPHIPYVYAVACYEIEFLNYYQTGFTT